MPCECIVCDYCDGSGYVWQTLSGHITRHRCDDMGDLVECPHCDGRAMLQMCYECAEAMTDEEI